MPIAALSASRKRQQHRLLDPLMRDPRAVALFGDAQPAAVELADHMRNRVAHGGRRRRRRQRAARVPRAIDRLLQAFHPPRPKDRILHAGADIPGDSLTTSMRSFGRLLGRLGLLARAELCVGPRVGLARTLAFAVDPHRASRGGTPRRL
jgi:hypothetical protein